MADDHTAGLIERASVLEAAHCAEICRTISALRRHWVQRDAAALYTLGAALYLDAPRAETLEHFGRDGPPPGQYMEYLARNNPLLMTHFAALYDALATTVGDMLGAAVCYAADRALPGFHIYEDAQIYAEQKSHVPHFDRQYECINWPNPALINFEDAISITLPLQLPRLGGGLRVWDLSLQQVQALAIPQARELAANAHSRQHVYRVGELVCHRGHLLHQVAPWRSVAGDARITLQAHGLYYDNAWQLYW